LVRRSGLRHAAPRIGSARAGSSPLFRTALDRDRRADLGAALLVTVVRGLLDRQESPELTTTLAHAIEVGRGT